MNLQTSIQLLELLAGGPGSGCRGPNCGRPASRYVTNTVKTPGGVTYTTLKPRDKQTPKVHDPRRRKHPLKGRFGKLLKHFGAGNVRPGQKLRTWISEARNWYGGRTGTRGATVFVHRYTDEKTNKPKATVVDEHNWIGYENRYSAPVRMEFKNQGRAATYIKRRYGLSIPTREYRS